MFKSVFSKYFTILATLLLVTLVAMGALQMAFLNNYWIEDKRIQLTETSERIALHTADVTTRRPDNPDTYVIITGSIKPVVDLLSESLSTDIFIVDTDGRLLIASNSAQVTQQAVSDQALSQLRESGFAVSTMNGLFSSMHYTAVTPIVTQDDQLIGYVISAMPADDLMAYLIESMQTFLMSAVIVLLVLFVVIYILTDRLVTPLRDMAVATRRFAEGDFSYRVKVRGKDELAELAKALNTMAVSLSATDNMSRSFVANVSHELKTPMTTISGFVDGMLDGTIPPERHAHYLRIVSDEVKRLSRLVRSMLELSRIDNGTVSIHPVPFDLTDAVCGVLLSFEKRIEEKRINIAGLPECERMMVMADYDLIGQVVYNLLDNAVKFVDEGGELAVNIYREQGRVYCAIRNSGAGISAEEMPRVFERFYKTDRSRSLDKTGVGLGLYIVKTVINLHRGEIYVRSVQGEYCEFVFWLPEEAELPAGEASVKLTQHHE